MLMAGLQDDLVEMGALYSILDQKDVGYRRWKARFDLLTVPWRLLAARAKSQAARWGT